MFEINGETWYVKFVDSYHPILCMKNGDFTIGTCDDNTKTIYIEEKI